MTTGRRAQLIAVTVSAPGLAVIVAVAAWRTPGYSHLAETVSRLGSEGEPAAALARAGFVAYGLLVAFGATAVAASVLRGRPVGAWLVIVYAGAAVLAGLAPKDPPGPVHTAASEVHVVATVVGGAAIVGAMLLAASLAPTPWARRIHAATAAAVVAGSIVFRWTWGSSYYGLVERLLLATGAGWLSIIAVLALAGRSQTNKREAIGAVLARVRR